MSNTAKCNVHDLLALFEDVLKPEDVLAAKLMAQVSEAITKERIRLHMTQAEFADHIHVKQSQISRWECGNYNFSLEKIADIAAKLNLDVNFYAVSMEVHKDHTYNMPPVVCKPYTCTFTFGNYHSIPLSHVDQSVDSWSVISKSEEDNYVTIR